MSDLGENPARTGFTSHRARGEVNWVEKIILNHGFGGGKARAQIRDNYVAEKAEGIIVTCI